MQQQQQQRRKTSKEEREAVELAAASKKKKEPDHDDDDDDDDEEEEDKVEITAASEALPGETILLEHVTQRVTRNGKPVVARGRPLFVMTDEGRIVVVSGRSIAFETKLEKLKETTVEFPADGVAIVKFKFLDEASTSAPTSVTSASGTTTSAEKSQQQQQQQQQVFFALEVRFARKDAMRVLAVLSNLVSKLAYEKKQQKQLALFQKRNQKRLTANNNTASAIINNSNNGMSMMSPLASVSPIPPFNVTNNNNNNNNTSLALTQQQLLLNHNNNNTNNILLDHRNLCIVHFNDTYNLAPTDMKKAIVGGASRFNALLRTLREAGKHPMVVFSGDFMGPSLMSVEMRGRQMIDAFNLIGVDFASFGNHEFSDYGTTALKDALYGAPIPPFHFNGSHSTWISTNLVDSKTGAPACGAEPWVIVRWGEVRVGILGLCENWLAGCSRLKPGELKYLDIYEIGERCALELKHRGAEFVIALTHCRLAEDKKVSERCPAIDYILGGHDHFYKSLPKYRLVKSGEEFKYLTEVNVKFRTGVTQPVVNIKTHPVESSMPTCPKMEALIRSYDDRVKERMGVTVGKTHVTLDPTEECVRFMEGYLSSFFCDLMADETGADLALLGGAAVSGKRSLPPGDITFGDILEWFPGNPKVMTIKMSGATLRKLIGVMARDCPEEAQSFPHCSQQISFVINVMRQPAVVEDIEYMGAPLEDDDMFVVALEDFAALGKGHYKFLKTEAKLLFHEEEAQQLLDWVVEYFIERKGQMRNLIAQARREEENEKRRRKKKKKLMRQKKKLQQQQKQTEGEGEGSGEGEKKKGENNQDDNDSDDDDDDDDDNDSSDENEDDDDDEGGNDHEGNKRNTKKKKKNKKNTRESAVINSKIDATLTRLHRGGIARQTLRFGPGSGGGGGNNNSHDLFFSTGGTGHHAAMSLRNNRNKNKSSSSSSSSSSSNVNRVPVEHMGSDLWLENLNKEKLSQVYTALSEMLAPQDSFQALLLQLDRVFKHTFRCERLRLLLNDPAADLLKHYSTRSGEFVNFVPLSVSGIAGICATRRVLMRTNNTATDEYFDPDEDLLREDLAANNQNNNSAAAGSGLGISSSSSSSGGGVLGENNLGAASFRSTASSSQQHHQAAGGSSSFSTTSTKIRSMLSSPGHWNEKTIFVVQLINKKPNPNHHSLNINEQQQQQNQQQEIIPTFTLHECEMLAFLCRHLAQHVVATQYYSSLLRAEHSTSQLILIASSIVERSMSHGIKDVMSDVQIRAAHLLQCHFCHIFLIQDGGGSLFGVQIIMNEFNQNNNNNASNNNMSGGGLGEGGGVTSSANLLSSGEAEEQQLREGASSEEFNHTLMGDQVSSLECTVTLGKQGSVDYGNSREASRSNTFHQRHQQLPDSNKNTSSSSSSAAAASSASPDKLATTATNPAAGATYTMTMTLLPTEYVYRSAQKGLIGEVITKGQTLNVPVAVENEKYDIETEAEILLPDQACMIMPLQSSRGRDVIIGALAFSAPTSADKSKFDLQDVQLGEDFATFCSIAIEQCYEVQRVHISSEEMLQSFPAISLGRIRMKEGWKTVKKFVKSLARRKVATANASAAAAAVGGGGSNSAPSSTPPPSPTRRKDSNVNQNNTASGSAATAFTENIIKSNLDFET